MIVAIRKNRQFVDREILCRLYFPKERVEGNGRTGKIHHLTGIEKKNSNAGSKIVK
jgi:hypothetical protein